MTSTNQLSAQQWNERYHIGTLVCYQTILPMHPEILSIETKTRSAAWELEAGRPVVFVDDIDGCIPLSRLEVILPIIERTAPLPSSYEAAKVLFRKVLKTISELKYDLASEQLVELGLPEKDADLLVLVVAGNWTMMSSLNSTKIRVRSMRMIVKLSESLIPYIDGYGNEPDENNN